MASVPVCNLLAIQRMHSELVMQQRRKYLEKDNPCAEDPLGSNARPPALATYFLKNGQKFTQQIRTNPDGSTTACAIPVENGMLSSCSPSVLIRSDKFDPTAIKQKELKPVSSQSQPGVGPRKG